ncbi:interferon-induced GTP-binding protein Mx [Alternaria rosae]|uniref:interferon-induced GTP-binding protein Mx n=1 Tax=Alternaria rosae TaxID=1187941 RepID=UPI001E8D93B7|nr:interferon-induced GTP-binding protein Mx [Alternaria rosae]KAH6865449.1 interferon-induced GTP-binding protein Mx [Alternaria rosae]
MKRPVSPSDDGTIADAPLGGTTNLGTQSNSYTPSQEPELHSARDDVSRLSEGLEPLHLVGQDDPQQTHNACAAGEIDPLGQQVKEVIATINRLEGLGLQRLKIPLPKCIVLGEQSTGKSSVIEAISGIKTPRADDTCTRCPLFIKLEPSEDSRAGWSASVSLRRGFGYDGNKSRGFEHRFPGWVEMARPNVVHFADTEDPHELEDIIARAQLAIINPMMDYTDFLGSTVATLREKPHCDFSPNIVCISISHPTLPALSFYDLPGIINQAETQDKEFLVDFVRNLVTDYVKDEEALILVTCSLDTDIANSSAGGIARKLNATDRCIGVLTKPDLIPEGSRHDKLMEVFDEKRFALGHGYFVVKNLNQVEMGRGLTHTQARFKEHQFFSQGTPWSTEFSHYQHRFGTLNLQGFLSGKLAEQMTKMLPIIDQEINARLEQVLADLREFPDPPTHNAPRIISDVVLDFSHNVRKELEAAFPCKAWRNNWRTLQKAFFDALASMKPTMSTSGSRDATVYMDVLGAQPGSSASKAIAVDDDDDNEDYMDDGDCDTPMSSNPETPTKKRKLGDAPGPSPAKTPSRRGPPKTTEGRPAVTSPDFSELRKKFFLDQVTQHLAENSQSKVPGQIEPRVVDNMMLETLAHWSQPLHEFFNTLEGQIVDQMKAVFHKHFSKYQGSTFYRTAWQIVEQMVSLNFTEQRNTMANESLNDEKEGPFIFHDELFELEKEAVLEHYRQARFKTRLNIYKRDRLKRTGKETTPKEENRMSKDVRVMAVLNHEPYVVELGVIAQVTTYYMLAARRFHDAVCMRIESKFFKQLRTQLPDELENGLGMNDGSEAYHNAVRLLSESAHRFSLRMELSGQRDSLLKGQEILRDLQNKKYGTAKLSSASNGGSRTRRSSASGDIPTPVSAEMEDVDMAGVSLH